VSSLTKILILAAFANGLSWIVLIPIWQYPDEQSHFAQVQNIAELGNSPKVGPDTSLEIALSEKFLDTERDGLGNNKFTYNPYYHIDYSKSQDGLFEQFIKNLPKESKTTMVKREATHNPPLYHIMASNFYRIFSGYDLFTRVYAIRFFSVIIYLAAVAMIINASKLVFKNSNASQISLATGVAFTPMLVFSSSGVLPDPLTILLFISVITLCLKLIDNELNWKMTALLFAVIFLGTKTRQQFPIAVLIILFPLIYRLTQHFSSKVVIMLTLGTMVLILTGSILFREYLKYIVEFHEIRYPNLALIFSGEFKDYLVLTIRHYYAQTLPWYWGVYKWLSLTVPHIFYQIINRTIALSLLGLVIWAVKLIKAKKPENTDIKIIFLIYTIFVYFFVFFTWDFYFQKTYGYSFGIQGRYFLPIILAITATVFYGLKIIFQSLFNKYMKILYFFLICGVVIFNDVSLVYVASSYYNPGNLQEFVAQVSQYKPLILKGNIIIVILLVAFMAQLIFFINLFRYTKTNND